VNKPKYKVFDIETDDVKGFKRMANETISNTNRSAD
jgi:hypothetical protein